jgi:LmbE family N-acetylglucosaminyl deacetylase
VNLPQTCFGLAAGEAALAVGTHPDDETLGAGGTLHRLAAAGIKTYVLAVTCPEPPAGRRCPPYVRIAEFSAACNALGVKGRVLAWAGGDAASDPGAHLRELVTVIESGPEVSLEAVRPALMLIPSATGFHQDHHTVHRACFAAARPGGAGRHTPRIVVGYAGPEDAWTTAAEPWTVYIDTTASWPAKQAALASYGSQLRDDTHPRSISRIRAIDTAAGAAAGTGMAERFVCYRMAF